MNSINSAYISFDLVNICFTAELINIKHLIQNLFVSSSLQLKHCGSGFGFFFFFFFTAPVSMMSSGPGPTAPPGTLQTIFRLHAKALVCHKFISCFKCFALI